MSRFQPTQGPGLGFQTIEVTGRALNDANAGVRGEAKGLTTSADGPYALMLDTNATQVAVGLCGVLLRDTPANERGNLCVVGRCHGLVGTGGVDLNDHLTINTSGAFVTAIPGDHINARALEGGAAGTLIDIDLDGDRGFGVAPTP